MAEQDTAFLAGLRRVPREGGLLRILPGGRLLATTVDVAATRAARRRGLLGRPTVPPGYALVLLPCRAVHTWGMAVPIDVIFVTGAGEVVRVCSEVRPWRVAAAWRAHVAVEVAAGAARDAGVKVGCWLAIDPRGEALTVGSGGKRGCEG